MLMLARDCFCTASILFVLKCHMHMKTVMYSFYVTEKGLTPGVLRDKTLDLAQKKNSAKKCNNSGRKASEMVMSDNAPDLADISASRYHVRCEVAAYISWQPRLKCLHGG